MWLFRLAPCPSVLLSETIKINTVGDSVAGRGYTLSSHSCCCIIPVLPGPSNSDTCLLRKQAEVTLEAVKCLGPTRPPSFTEPSILQASLCSSLAFWELSLLSLDCEYLQSSWDKIGLSNWGIIRHFKHFKSQLHGRGGSKTIAKSLSPNRVTHAPTPYWRKARSYGKIWLNTDNDHVQRWERLYQAPHSPPTKLHVYPACGNSCSSGWIWSRHDWRYSHPTLPASFMEITSHTDRRLLTLSLL